MAKLKTKKGVAKRFRLTAKGKVTYSPCGKGHLMSGKNRARLRGLKQERVLEGKQDVKYIKRMLLK